MTKPHFLTLGPEIPIVPVTHFKRERFEKGFFDKAWYLVGPTVEKNLKTEQPWTLYCICFIEGMRMGIAAMERGQEIHPLVQSPESPESPVQPSVQPEQPELAQEENWIW